METTIGSLVTEIERLVKPLDFKIDKVYRDERQGLIATGTDDSKICITIVRDGKVG